MTAFTQAFTLVAGTGFNNPPIGATGATALPTAFGISINAGNNDFATMLNTTVLGTTTWQAGINTIGGIGLIRVLPDFLITGAGGIWNSRAAWTAATPNFAHVDNLTTALKQMAFAGRVVFSMGRPDGTWLDITNTVDQDIYGQMAVQLATRFIANGYTGITYWEGPNEQESFVTAAQLAACHAALATRLKAFNPAYVVGGPVLSNDPALGGRAAYVTATKNAMGTNMGFISYHYYNNALVNNHQNQFAAAIAGVNPPTSGYGVVAANTRALVAGNLPLLLGEYNMHGVSDPTEVDQQTHIGAVYNTLAILDSIKNGNLEMGAIFSGWEDFPTGAGAETYGIINGATTQTNGGTFPPGQIYPVAYTLGRLFQKMPGNVVNTNANPSSVRITPPDGTGLYTMATVIPNTSTFGIALVNSKDTGAITVNVAISTVPQSVTYFEISATHLTPLIQTKTAAQLAALSIPAMSVVILSP